MDTPSSITDEPLFKPLEFTIKSFAARPLSNNKQRYSNKKAIRMITNGEKLYIKELILDLNIPAVLNKVEIWGITNYASKIKVYGTNNSRSNKYTEIFDSRPIVRDKMKRICIGNIPVTVIKIVFAEEVYFNPININLWGSSIAEFQDKMGSDLYTLLVQNTSQLLRHTSTTIKK